MKGPTVRRPLRAPAPPGRRFILAPPYRLLAFAVGVLALEAVAFVLQLSRDVTPFVLVVIPAAAAGVVSWASGGRREVRSLVGRLFVWRVHAGWYLAALGIPVAEKLVVDAAGVLAVATSPDRLLAAWSASALLVPIVVVVPAMLEEIGWRGFGVQAALDAGRSPRWAALVVGLIFMMLHVPLYLPGQLYDGLPVWPLPFILLSSSVLLTWIYLRTSSALLAGLMHAAFNASVPLTWGLDGAWVWKARAITLTIFAAALFVSRQFHMTRQQSSIRGARS
jgi:membrane protease YdiL (CAAX protease family)